ncbi:uncharacterized protein LOC127790873 [Diospyros lotus]|uniref:uncharacterized protein LOC127790873 n=1 Tax=Diospyros lotus TaxID=55363 RepID=UPI0022558192|nr:uncharacterized protein LOC127790873 [Diospyros lotus]XP_052176562.1 uncharacterized protein LOC127790873 [Diospyros lotus]
MDSAEAEYAAFQERVSRTVYMDNLSPQVTEAVLKTALGQFVNVNKVHIIPNYTHPSDAAGRALVEMENPKQAEQIVRDMGNLPFMMSGMPRPIRARAADPEMFDDRPRKPGKRITFRWLDQQDPDFQVAKKLKDLTRKNAAEASFIMERQVGEEEKLANQQWKTLKANYKKYELIDGVLGDGTALRLAERYNTRIFDDK